MQTRIWVDGHLSAPEEATVPVLDRGFLYGDSVYEVLWWHRGTLIQEQDHLDRLRGSGRHVYMDVTATDAELVGAVRETCAAAEVGPDEDAYVRLVVTRGSGPLGLDPARHENQRIVVVVAPAGRPTAAVWERGLHLHVAGRRRNPRGALDPRAKTGNYLNNILALHEAHLAGADDAVMLNGSDEVTEATTANIYAVDGGALATPPLDAGILEGTTRMRILALCESAGIPAAERVLRADDLREATELFVSSSVRGILPVCRLDDQPVGDGQPGPLTTRIRSLFEAAADEEAGRAASARDVRGGDDDTP